MTKTYGQRRVRLDFNPSKFPEVDKIKKDTSEIMDYLTNLKNPEEKFRELPVKDQNEEPYKEASTKTREYIETLHEALKYYELACMYAVKALTV